MLYMTKEASQVPISNDHLLSLKNKGAQQCAL